jgi:hypothetical protein
MELSIEIIAVSRISVIEGKSFLQIKTQLLYHHTFKITKACFLRSPCIFLKNKISNYFFQGMKSNLVFLPKEFIEEKDWIGLTLNKNCLKF